MFCFCLIFQVMCLVQAAIAYSMLAKDKLKTKLPVLCMQEINTLNFILHSRELMFVQG